ncbi:flagellar basal-body MS-ring/collar protein FliF [Anaerobranca gottschalkii]|uniref:Flagellar M-ring protein n=1 Tax=Anaerobranca gottschalkii DSM 13577 TaxID=1120990 RepID=A0A1H9ZDS9_9FIRM|nr:flagellar basal-body MS-ring/collar protein FliF [Anaerobranca gottschalkii]SES79665.1 flagellar M-ring protein FliF [Anaerobranca gottschalkii DSM 13577]
MNLVNGNIAEQLREFWTAKSAKDKTKIIAIIFFTITTLTMSSLLLFTSDLETVFTNLSSQDVAEITMKLRERNIKYKVIDGGTGIQVPKDLADDVRIQMASLQLPRNSGVIGYELLENISRFAPESERQMLYLQALQGEIRRTIELFEEVTRAQVLITLPKDSIYIREREPAKAAVTLFLKPGVRLSPGQISGIKHLVAHSVEGLTYDNVFLTDQNMRPLDGDYSNDYTDINENIRKNMQIKEEFEKNLENSLTSLLKLYYGEVAVKVNAELNFDRLVKETQLFDPLTNGERIIRSMEVLEEYYRNYGEYTPGDGEIPYYPGINDGSSEAERRQEIINYEINQVKEHLVVAPGAVKRLSVAVMLNKELEDEEKEIISDFIAVAAGLDTVNRMDQISVIGKEFTSSDVGVDQPPITIKMPWLTKDVALILGTILGAVVVLGLLLFRNKKNDYEIPPIAATTDVSEEEIEINPKDKTESLKRLAKKNPEGFSKVLRTWLAEE